MNEQELKMAVEWAKTIAKYGDSDYARIAARHGVSE